MAKKYVEVTEEVFEVALEHNMGWCPGCKDFTTHDVESDCRPEHGYECAECPTFVYGAQEALDDGLFFIK